MISNPSYQNFATFDKSEYPHLWDGVVGAWCPSLGPTGTRLHDVSGKGNWGTLTNMDAATDWVVDRGQYALDFDGVNDYIDTGFRRAGGQVQITISIWVKRAPNNFFYVGDGAANSGLAIEFYPTVTYFNFASPSSDYSQTNFTPDNNWHHFVFVYNCFGSSNTERAKIFLDGSEKASAYPTPTPTSLTVPTQNFVIGRRQWVVAYGKSIADDCVFWNRALHANEVRELYQIGRGGMYAPRRRRKVSVQVGNAIWLKTGGVWKETTPWIKVGGTWKTATPNINVSGVWK